MKAFLLTLLHLTVMTATLCGPGPAPFLTTLPSARGGERGPKNLRSGPRNLDSGLSEISIVFQAAVPKLVASKYTTSGVRRPSEL